jgi:hypothetical protein
MMGILKKVLGATALSAGLAFAGGASAGVIPYDHAGTINPAVYSFTAASTGPIEVFFVGSSASLDENIGLLVNGVPTGLVGLGNHLEPSRRVQSRYGPRRRHLDVRHVHSASGQLDRSILVVI